jgi:hypothetical protein
LFMRLPHHVEKVDTVMSHGCHPSVKSVLVGGCSIERQLPRCFKMPMRVR